MTEEKIRLLVVDDHTLFRRGLIALLSQDERFEIVGEAGDVSEALRVLPSARPDLVLLDNHLPGVKGVDAIPSFKEGQPELRVMMLTVSEDEDDLSRALQAGADGYLLKTSESDQLCDAIVKVKEGHSMISPQMMGKLVAALRGQGATARPQEPTPPASPQALDKLSPREREILTLIAKGQSNKQIARELDIAETTVKIRVQHIFKKLDLSSRVQVAVLATSLGLG